MYADMLHAVTGNPTPHPNEEEASMGRRYGPSPGEPALTLVAYHQSKDELADFPAWAERLRVDGA